MKHLFAISLSLFLAGLTASPAMEQPSFHTKGLPTGKPTGPLKPGEYWWAPYVSPTGPVMVLISVPQQVMNVYRNGLLVGRSSISTGSTGHETPGGVYTILEKKETHYSKTYDNAPMPNMQRLTWSGIAMHSGNLPGRPASHGCIRLPYDFSKLLFALTANGGTVVVGDDKTPQPFFASNPGILLAPKDFTSDMLKPLAKGEFNWQPERSKIGPVTVLISAADRALYVYRNGTPIGRAPVEITGRGPLGGHVLSMLNGVQNKQSSWVPGRSARNWMTVTTDAAGRRVSIEDLGRRIRINPVFAGKLYDTLTPGATVVVIDQPAVRKLSRDSNILGN